ncbi:azobenzene reductase [Streptomyces sp. V4I23]|uniref:NADPH-dependent FMN reductase n=1 Tax=Streptomyces sp. V4I23 TaxID=3042282 RepID=UPI002788563F|nr:NADPH-dependent FMN reductase [Streptomyces sp. V4I23]MDQ1007706.1 azobenzene reductase [Streptomyces sp. V4I23]
MTVRPQVLMISGSPRNGSHTAAVLRAGANCLVEEGADPLLWDLAAHPLPVVEAECHGRPERYGAALARKLPLLAARADAFVLASPAYHGAYSGVLKNALDHLDAGRLRGKPVALVAHGENLSAVQVCDGLRTVVRALRAVAVPEQLVTVPGDFAHPAGGGPELVAPAALDRLGDVCRALTSMACRTGRPAMAGVDRGRSPQ